MPQRRSKTRHQSGATSVNVLQQGGVVRGHIDRGVPNSTTQCCAPLCERPPAVEEGMPVVLCAKHLREAYEFAKAMIDERWLPAVVQMLAD